MARIFEQRATDGLPSAVTMTSLEFDDLFSSTTQADAASCGVDQERSRTNSISSGPVQLGYNECINIDCFKTLSLLGSGAFGKVYLARSNQTSDLVAVKCLRKDMLLKQHQVAATRTERDVMKRADHPFIVSLHCCFTDANRLYLVMDYVSGGELLGFLRQEGIFSEEMVRFYIAELVLALEYLHDAQIVHRDLKPQNVLIDGDGHLKLCDFGLSKEGVNPDNPTSSFCGTVEYMSPEMIRGEPYDASTDLWSVGVLVYDMLMGSPPFVDKNQKNLMKKITSGKFKLPSYLQAPTHSLIKGLLQTNPAKRLTVKQLKAHPFFKGVNWDALVNGDLTPPIRPIIKTASGDKTIGVTPSPKKADMSPVMSRLSSSSELLFQGFSWVRPTTLPVN